MRIWIFSFKKIRSFFSLAKIAALILLIVLVSCFVLDHYTQTTAYVEAIRMESEKDIIVIDAGHGGEDPGAVGDNGVLEKNLNLEMALLIGEMLSESGYPVVYTRTEDKLLYAEDENIKGIRKISDLKNRCKIAAEYPKAVFVSLHMNSYINSKYSGLQVYYSTKNESSRILANKIQSSVRDKLQPQNNRVEKPGKSMYVLENIENIGVLIECGFISNSEECKHLLEKEYQKQLSSAIICAIIEYKENTSIHN